MWVEFVFDIEYYLHSQKLNKLANNGTKSCCTTLKMNFLIEGYILVMFSNILMQV